MFPPCDPNRIVPDQITRAPSCNQETRKPKGSVFPVTLESQRVIGDPGKTGPNGSYSQRSMSAIGPAHKRLDMDGQLCSEPARPATRRCALREKVRLS